MGGTQPSLRSSQRSSPSATVLYFATASADGQPYVQHRGGPPGFLRVLDERTLAFADYAGNRQYISTGNLAENNRAFLFLMDYAHRTRVKMWGRAEVVTDPATTARLMPKGYTARPEQTIVFHLTAWDQTASNTFRNWSRRKPPQTASRNSRPASTNSNCSWR